MAIPLSYAVKRRNPRADRMVGAIAAIVSLAVGIAIFFYVVPLGQRGAAAHLSRSLCGTGRYEAFRTLFFVVPRGFIVPVLGWYFAHRARYGQVAARCGVWVAVACWGVALLFCFLP
jgi:hypothetical protein